MTDLIKRDDALAAIDTALNNATGDLFDCHAAIRGLAAIDPAAIREAALQARIEELVKERDDLGRKLATCEKYRDAYAECDRIGTQAVRDLEAKLAKAVEDAEKWRYAFAAQSRKLQAVLYIEGVKAVLAELEGKA
jgi:hypothetical protein